VRSRSWRWVDVIVAEDLPHGRLGDLVAKTNEFAVCPLLAPRGVVVRELHYDLEVLRLSRTNCQVGHRGEESVEGAKLKRP